MGLTIEIVAPMQRADCASPMPLLTPKSTTQTPYLTLLRGRLRVALGSGAAGVWATSDSVLCRRQVRSQVTESAFLSLRNTRSR